ncbi:MAG TPA: hypothetical protein VN086_02555 [Candidatus Paceibacterota bacterium]|nr:hypothetical protein [Candidatus Paceibacterota bacterium]
MKFAGFEIPPRKAKQEAPEFNLVERPAPLSSGIVHEAPEQLEETVGAYVDAMNEYATQHDLFFAEEKKELMAAKEKLVTLSRSLLEVDGAHVEAQKKKIEEEMKDVLNQINGELSDKLQARAQGNKPPNANATEAEDFSQSALERHGPIRASEELGKPLMEVTAEDYGLPLELTEADELPPDATHGEVKRKLEKLRPSVISMQEEREKRANERVAEESKESHAEMEGEQPVLVRDRALEREQKAERFAEKFGLTEAREQLHAAEEAYKDALQWKRSTVWPLKDVAIQAAEEEYIQAQLAWRSALGAATENAKGQDKIMARFIGIRDTTLRPEALRQEAAREMLEAKEGKLGTKITGWIKSGARRIYSAYKEGTAYVGDKAAGVHQRLTHKEESLNERQLIENRKRLAERYTRSVRIVGGAIVMSAATGGWAGLGLPLLLRIGRGGAGVILGASAGGAAGKWYEKNVNAQRQQDLLEILRDIDGGIGVRDAAALAAEKKAYARGNAKARAKGRQLVEAGATLAVAGTTSLATGMAANHYTHLESVQKAANTLSENPGLAPTHAPTPIPTHTPAAGVEASVRPQVNFPTPKTPLGPVVSASIDTRGEGMGVLFENLKSAIRANGSFATNPSGGLRHFLETNPNILSREVGKAFDGNGMRMHMGDHFTVDEHENIWYEPAHGKSQLFIENQDNTHFKVHHLTESPRIAAEAPVHPRVRTEVPSKPSAVVSEPKTPVTEPVTNPTTAPAPAAQPEALTPSPTPEQPSTVAPTESVQPSAPTPEPAPETVATPEPQAPTPSPVQPESIPAPSPEPIPAAPTEAPVPPSVAPSAPIESAPSAPVPSASPESILMTPRGLPIDTSSPSAYSFDLPSGKSGIAIFGGSSDDRLLAAQEYLATHPGATVRFESTVKNLLSGKEQTTTLEWSSDPNGQILATPSSVFEGDAPIPKVDPNLFSKRLNFTFDKQP